MTSKPSRETRDEFKSMLGDDVSSIPESDRTGFHLRVAEIVRANSGGADSPTRLVVLTLPLPKRAVPAKLYLAWLGFLARGVEAPFLFVRGNQESVLTFYS